MGNKLLSAAAHREPATTKRGALERLFTFMFQGFVYNQIWEDPKVDLEALKLDSSSRLITIASGGCNVMTYLTANPKKIVAIDLNPNHIALTRLKVAALSYLPSYEDFFSFFGKGDHAKNRDAYDQFLVNRLDDDTRRYWQRWLPLKGRRINIFARNLYHYSLLGRFIGLVHFVARLHGKKPSEMLSAKNEEEQRQIFDRTIGPLFESKFVKSMARMPISFYGLGIPPAQHDELMTAAAGDPAGLFRDRIERLACDFPIDQNYFAWQAFGRTYDVERRSAVPDYLREDQYDFLRERINRVETHLASMTDYLEEQPAASLDRYVLLDSQDWMNEDQITALWRQITRTSSPGARVIFRTAGEESPLEKKLPIDVLENWTSNPDEGQRLLAEDRSSIYGGFHIYQRAA
jgi:S-adenosylmethionine-diacylglycerol 3-amino-3-carboxypropyl transferase